MDDQRSGLNEWQTREVGAPGVPDLPGLGRFDEDKMICRFQRIVGQWIHAKSVQVSGEADFQPAWWANMEWNLDFSRGDVPAAAHRRTIPGRRGGPCAFMPVFHWH